MFLGTATTDITPAVGTLLAGSLRPRASVGVADPLLCKAMVLDNGTTRLALVTLDLIGWTRGRSEAPRAALAARAGVAPENLLINCSHTHSGPYIDESIYLAPGDTLDDEYLARVTAALGDTVCAAAENQREVRVGTVKTRLGGVARNRRLRRPDGGVINAWLATAEERQTLAPAGPLDEDLLAWVFFAGARPVAALWNYTVHANAHFGTSFSADYPGRVAAALCAEFGPDFFTLFLSGTCGDINNTVGFEALSRETSAALTAAVRQARPGASEALGAVWREVTVGVRDREPFQEEEIRDKWPDGYETFAYEDQQLRANPQDEIVTVLQALRVGDGALAATPGETFAQLGLDLKARSPFAVTAALELSNDVIGYIPTQAAFAEGGYETFRSRWVRVVPGTGERMVAELLAMLAEL